MFVVGKYLITEFVHKLIKTQVHLQHSNHLPSTKIYHTAHQNCNTNGQSTEQQSPFNINFLFTNQLLFMLFINQFHTYVSKLDCFFKFLNQSRNSKIKYLSWYHTFLTQSQSLNNKIPFVSNFHAKIKRINVRKCWTMWNPSHERENIHPIEEWEFG